MQNFVLSNQWLLIGYNQVYFCEMIIWNLEAFARYNWVFAITVYSL